MRNKVVLGLATVACLGFAVMTNVTADDTKPDKKVNVQDAPKDAKATMKSKAIQDLELAHQLIRYGRQEKNAESLLLAAQILHKTPTKAMKIKSTTGNVDETTSRPLKVNNSPKALVAEAKKLSSDPQVEALAMATEKLLEESTRAPIGPVRVAGFTIFSNQTWTSEPVTFRGAERGEVYINTGIFSNMALEIIDELGNVVVRDNVPGNYYRCVWYPRWTGSFRFRLINYDSIGFNCRLATN